MVLAFAGDSTITRLFAIISSLIAFILVRCSLQQCRVLCFDAGTMRSIQWMSTNHILPHFASKSTIMMMILSGKLFNKPVVFARQLLDEAAQFQHQEYRRSHLDTYPAVPGYDVQVHGTVEQPLGYGFFFPAKFHKRSSVCASICIFCIMAYIQFIKYITDTRHDLGAVADQPVGASAAAGIYVPGHREDVPSLLQCIISGDE